MAQGRDDSSLTGVIVHLLHRQRALLGLPLLLGACRADICDLRYTLPADAQVQTIGDSILAWGEPTCTSVADYAGYALDTRVERSAISGTRLLGGDSPIPDQYVPGDWDWIIADGGANDLNNDCGCGDDCDAVLDSLSTPDGQTGAMPALVDDLLGRGHRVALVTYYLFPESAAYGFATCEPALTALNDRYAALAAARPGVVLVPLAQLISWEETPWAYDRLDDVHPSVRGAAHIGQHIAEQLTAASTAPE